MYEPGDERPFPPGNPQGSLTVEGVNPIRYFSPKSRRPKWFFQYLLIGLLDWIVRAMHENAAKDYDNLIVIEGDEGKGKSHLGYWICKLYDPNFDMNLSYVYDFETFLERMNDPKNNIKVFWFDEATNLAFSRDWSAAANSSFIQILQMIRSKNLALVMCIPHRSSLDKYIREERLRYLLSVQEMSWNGGEKGRGYFEFLIPNKVTHDPDDFLSLGYGRYEKMPADVRPVYERLKAKAFESKLQEKKEQFEGKRTREQYKKDKAAIGNLILELVDRGVTYTEISNITGLPYSTIKNNAFAARKRREENGDG